MKYHRMLNHPRVVNLDYVYEDSDEIYLVMEYVRAGSLLQRICDKGNLSERDTAKLISNLLETLTFLHDRRIVHRDVKVDNILMASPNNDYDIKVTDFGFCTSLDDENIDNMCGTPSYIAPELFQNQSIHDCKIDVYSAGVVAYICLVGKLPYNVDPS
jgi:serine/threonine protein kinase